MELLHLSQTPLHLFIHQQFLSPSYVLGTSFGVRTHSEQGRYSHPHKGYIQVETKDNYTSKYNDV